MGFDPEQVRFGNGRVIGTVLNDPEYDDLPAREQALRMGRAVGCPVVQKVMNERGGVTARDRYLQLGFWFGQMVHTAERVNEQLAVRLKTEVERRPDEPVGVHEPASVPGYYDQIIPPTETLTGFALPRLLIKLHDSDALSDKNPGDRFMTVWGMLEDAATSAETPSELLARCAQGALELGLDEDEVLKNTLPNGWYEEHNAYHMTIDGMVALAELAPGVWNTYTSYSEEKLEELGVFNVRSLD